MDVATLTNQYQRKMWKSMISRKKLDFSMWDVIEYKKEKVYYMPYNAYQKFEITTKHCLKCSKELGIGFRKNEFITKPCECSKDKKNHATLEKLTTLFSEEEAKGILKAFAEYKTRKLPNKIRYWLDQGYTEEEAELKIIEAQTNRSKRSPASKKGMTEYTCRRPEFWINKGYTEEEAKKKVSEHQVGNGLAWYINRYGKEEGTERYNKRIKKWIKSYNKALENDPTIVERKTVKLGKASKESLKIFFPIYKKFKDQVSIYLGVDGNVEYFLRDGADIWFYDFTIPELKIIVEFNGRAFHPNKDLLTEDEWNHWECVYNRMSADEKYVIDSAKTKLAENSGYTVITIWDTDDIQESIDKIEKVIKEKYEF